MELKLKKSNMAVDYLGYCKMCSRTTVFQLRCLKIYILVDNMTKLRHYFHAALLLILFEGVPMFRQRLKLHS